MPGVKYGQDRCVPDGVWRQSVTTEAAVAIGQEAATVLWDIHTCYEMIQHLKLAQKAREIAYPLQLLRSPIASSRWPRRLRHGRMLSRELWPHRGVVAGAVSAVYEL